jgi:hypothetical protein
MDENDKYVMSSLGSGDLEKSARVMDGAKAHIESVRVGDAMLARYRSEMGDAYGLWAVQMRTEKAALSSGTLPPISAGAEASASRVHEARMRIIEYCQ